MTKRVAFVHGVGNHPERGRLNEHCREMLAKCLREDFGKAASPSVDSLYWCDIANRELGREDFEGFCVDQICRVLAARRLAVRSSWSRYLRSVVGRALIGSLELVSWTPTLAGMMMPELGRFLAADEFATMVRRRVREPLQQYLEQGDEVLVLAHSWGSVIAYESLVELTQTYRGPNRIQSFITMGSPIAVESVKHRLLNWKNPESRFPRLIKEWHNIADPTDEVSHDPTVSDDFHDMQTTGAIEMISDHLIQNPARAVTGDPHDLTGYLTHPVTVRLVEDFLRN